MQLVPMTLESLQILKPKLFYVMWDSGVVETFRFIEDSLEYWEAHSEEWEHFGSISSIPDSDFLNDKKFFLITGKDTK